MKELVRAYALSILADFQSTTEDDLARFIDPESTDFSKDTAAELVRVETMLEGFAREIGEKDAR